MLTTIVTSITINSTKDLINMKVDTNELNDETMMLFRQVHGDLSQIGSENSIHGYQGS